MKVCSTCKIVKAFKEFGKDSRLKSGLTARCKECKNKVQKTYVRVNKELVYTKNREYYKENKLEILESKRAYREENLPKILARNARRHSRKIKRTPPWLTKEDLKEIQDIYTECSNITLETGIPHHVDHVIPLQGELVSGLHVPSNLQILSATENLKKNNRFDV